MTSPLENPWLKIPRSAPFILPSDRDAISSFHDIVNNADQLKLNLLPIPYLGLPTAPIVLLNLNSGYHPLDDTLQSTSAFKRALRGCLRHADTKYPFFFLDPNIEGKEAGPGHLWWCRIFRIFTGEHSYELCDLAKAFFCVEYLPYRSRRYLKLGSVLESQHYGFELVRDAMKRRALVVIMRSKQMWFDAIPDLEKYKNLHIANNPRNPVLSQANLPQGFPQILRILARLRRGNTKTDVAKITRTA
jgi:hypothetical protein